MTTRRRLVGAALGVMLVWASLARAQRIWVGDGRFGRVAPRFAALGDFDGRFLYCRAFFGSGYGGGWATDYPGADNNFSVRLAELTRVDVKFGPDNQPHHVVVRLDDPTLFRCPALFIENVERLRFTESEIAGLRDYLLKGGFLWADDFWGSAAWDNWAEEIARVLPPGQYPMFDVPLSHPIMHTVYDVKAFQHSGIRSLEFT